MALPASLRVAVVQAGPSYLDLPTSLQRALHFVKTSAQQGAQLVVFPETWLSGYPIWLDISPGMNIWDDPTAKDLFARTHASAIEVPGPETQALAEAAHAHNITIVMGANERVATGPGNGSLYNVLLILDSSGELRVHHRKLMPTHTERLVHAPGDAGGLHAVDINGVRIGGMICWEHWMPLTRQVLHDSGEHLHLALWPHVKEQNHLASRHYALEGRCFVIAAGARMQAKELPEGIPLPDEIASDPDQWIMRGGSAIYGPDGELVAGPGGVDDELLVWDLPDLSATIRERMALDVTGHYQRRDVFGFTVDRQRNQ